MTTISIVDVGAVPDGRDNRSAIQAACDKAVVGDTVLIPPYDFFMDAVSGTDNMALQGIKPKSGTTLRIEGTLRALPNSSPHYILVNVWDASDVTITGKGKIIGDNDNHTGPPTTGSEWGHGMFINGARNLTIGGGLTITKCHGDGIAMNDGTNVAVDRVIFDGNYRQNFSMSQVRGLRVTNNSFRNAGFVNLDIEPEFNGYIEDVLVQYNEFVNAGTRSGLGSKKVHIGIGSEPNVGSFKNVKVIGNNFDDKMQPIWVHGTAGDTGIPWYAWLLNVTMWQGAKSSAYRFWGYPKEWTSKT